MNERNERTPDPVIDEIREIRHRISASCGHDVDKLVEYYQKLQAQFPGRMIGSPPKTDHPAA